MDANCGQGMEDTACSSAGATRVPESFRSCSGKARAFLSELPCPTWVCVLSQEHLSGAVYLRMKTCQKRAGLRLHPEDSASSLPALTPQ